MPICILGSEDLHLSSYVVMHAGKMWTVMCMWLYIKRGLCGRSTVILMREERTSGSCFGEGEHNVDYDTILWYI